MTINIGLLAREGTVGKARLLGVLPGIGGVLALRALAVAHHPSQVTDQGA